MQRLDWSMAGERHGHSARRAIALIRGIYADCQPINAVPSETNRSGGSLSRLLKAGMPLILMPLLRTPDLGILMQRSGAGSIQSARDPYLPAGTAIGPGKRAT